MKNKLSLNRIWFLLKNEIIRNRKIYLILACIQAASFVMAALGGVEGLLTVHASFTTFTVGFSVLLPFIIFSRMFHPVKGLAYAMLPASQEEKFLANFLLCTLIFPLFMLLTGFLLGLVGWGITGNSNAVWHAWNLFVSHSGHGINLGFFDSTYWHMLMLQSYAFWCVYFFKEKKFWRGALTGIVTLIVLSIIGHIIAGSYHVAISGWQIDYITETARHPAVILTVLINFVVPLGLWTWAFFKGCKQQF